METTEETKEFSELHKRLYDAILNALIEMENEGPMAEVQPPTSVAELAAEAATTVLMAFERGYRME